MEESNAVSVHIMDKEYRLACSEAEREALFAAVEYLNKRMRELKNSGKVIGSERIAVMTALNMAHELLAIREQSENFSHNVDATLKRIHSKVDNVLTRQVEPTS